MNGGMDSLSTPNRAIASVYVPDADSVNLGSDDWSSLNGSGTLASVGMSPAPDSVRGCTSFLSV